MYRISVIISEIYNKFLPLAEKDGIKLNLDVIDSEVLAEELAGIKGDVEKAVSEALGRSVGGEISIQVNPHEIIIADTGTTLSQPVCKLLSVGRVAVSSHVGFGTKVRISLERKNNEKALADGTKE